MTRPWDTTTVWETLSIRLNKTRPSMTIRTRARIFQTTLQPDRLAGAAVMTGGDANGVRDTSGGGADGG
jgi:hypothetical protein